MAEMLFQIFEAEIGRQIEAQLRELDGNFGGKIRVVNAVEHFQVMLGNAAGFGAVGNIFAEMGEDGADIFLQEGLRGERERRREFLRA